MAQGVHKITEDFERSLCDYTGAPYAIALDNMSNALFLALYYEKNIKQSLSIFLQTMFLTAAHQFRTGKIQLRIRKVFMGLLN